VRAAERLLSCICSARRLGCAFLLDGRRDFTTDSFRFHVRPELLSGNDRWLQKLQWTLDPFPGGRRRPANVKLWRNAQSASSEYTSVYPQ